MNNHSIKVLSVCTSDSSGGAARAAYRIHKAVRNLGVDSKMFVKDKRSDDPNILPISDFLPNNTCYRAFDWARNKIKNKWQHYQWGKYPDRSDFFLSDLRSTDIGHALQKIDYDILHLHWVNLRFLPLQQLPKDKPIVWTLHDSWPFCGVCHYFLDCSEYQRECGNCALLGSNDSNDLSHKVWLRKRELYNKLHLHIVTPSRWLGECSRISGLFHQFPHSVIPNCIDTETFHPLFKNVLSRRWDFLSDNLSSKRYVLYGAMNAARDKIKGFSYLVSALSILKETNQADFELIVFGSERPFNWMSDIVPTHYVGYITNEEELVSLYNLSSVVVVPSLSENLSCAIMESLSCGTPVVAFDIGGNCDMILHKKNGFLASKMNAKELAEGIHWCLNSKCKDISMTARQTVLERYTPQIVAEQYRSIYNTLLR